MKRKSIKRKSIRYKKSKKRNSKSIKRNRRSIKRNSKSIKRNRRSIKHKSIRHKMRGGEAYVPPSGVTGVILDYSPGPPVNVFNVMQANDKAQNNANKLAGGGTKRSRTKRSRTKRSRTKQRGGDNVIQTLTNNALKYLYKAPDGMNGPVPQPATTNEANNLIITAAKISTQAQENAKYDNNLGVKR